MVQGTIKPNPRVTADVPSGSINKGIEEAIHNSAKHLRSPYREKATRQPGNPTQRQRTVIAA
jgi:hypothetical protein